MATISESDDRRRNAALFSTFYLASSRRSGQPPAALPAQMRPVGFDRAAAYFDGADLADPWVRRAYRSSLLELNNSGCAAQTKALLAAWYKQADPKLASNDAALADCFRQLKSRTSPPPKPDVFPSFDQETWITTVTVKFTIKVKDRAEAIRLVKPAYPANWAVASDTFFKQAELGIFDELEFKPHGTRQPNWSEPVFLHERVCWAWNGDNEFETDNHFSIRLLGVAAPGDRGSPGPDGKETILHYTYGLSSCNWSKAFVVWDKGGLDVDQGYYKAELGRDGQLTIEANKEVRFVAPSNGPYEIALALNLMAPATISMLLSRLNDYVVHDDESYPDEKELQWPELPPQRATSPSTSPAWASRETLSTSGASS